MATNKKSNKSITTVKDALIRVQIDSEKISSVTFARSPYSKHPTSARENKGVMASLRCR